MPNHTHTHAHAAPRLLALSYPVLDDEEDEEAVGQGSERRMAAYTEEDRKHMRRALELAAKALGA